MHQTIASIVQLFPNFEKKIDGMFQHDENFRDLCSDYLLCTSMILEGKKEMNKNWEEFVEFVALQRDLEEEILKEILKENNIL
mgnify:CR=1 FL=1